MLALFHKLSICLLLTSVAPNAALEDGPILPINIDHIAGDRNITNHLEFHKKIVADAWRRTVDHCHHTEENLSKLPEGSRSIEEIESLLEQAKKVTFRYFQQVAKTYWDLCHTANEALGVALKQLHADLKPWTSTKLLQSVVTGMESIIKEVAQVLVEFGQVNQRELFAIHDKTVRQLLVLQKRVGSLSVSTNRIREVDEILEWKSREIDTLMRSNRTVLWTNLNNIVNQLHRYIRKVLQFAEEVDDSIASGNIMYKGGA